MSSGPRPLPRVALQLGLLDATAAPADLMHREKAARGLVDVDDAVCADCVLVHEPAQLDEEPVNVGLLLLRAVELLQALGGLLEGQAHATQEPPYPMIAGAHVEPLCVEPLEHQAVDRDRTQAQDVGHLHDVLAEPRRVCGRPCSWRAPLPAVGSVRVDPVEHSKAQALDLAQAPPHGPACRRTNRWQWGRPGPCGASNHCRWARLQRVRRLEWLARHGES